jgi:tetratricopeptide (TPR) repeat protein
MDKLQAAINLANQGNLDKAVAAFEKILQQNPRNIDALYNLGICFIALGKPNNAIAVLVWSLECAPGRANIHIALGDAYSLLDDLGNAKEHLVTALGISIDDQYALRKLGVIYGKLGEMANSAYCFRRYKELYPED